MDQQKVVFHMSIRKWLYKIKCLTYHAAPTTDSDIHKPTPIEAHIYGDVSDKNLKADFS